MTCVRKARQSGVKEIVVESNKQATRIKSEGSSEVKRPSVDARINRKSNSDVRVQTKIG